MKARNWIHLYDYNRVFTIMKCDAKAHRGFDQDSGFSISVVQIRFVV